MPGCKLRKVNPVPLLLILLMLGQPCPDALICDVDQLVHDLTLLIIGGTPPQRNVREEDLLSLAVLLVLVSSLTPVKVDLVLFPWLIHAMPARHSRQGSGWHSSPRRLRHGSRRRSYHHPTWFSHAVPEMET